MARPVVLIEDSTSLQLVYASVLRGAGFEVVTAGTAQEGYDAFCEIRPHAVVLDLMLPDRDGLDLMRDLLRLHPQSCFVVITSNGSISRAVEAMRAGAYEFLVKPFAEARMVAAVRNAAIDADRRIAADLRAVVRETPIAEHHGFIGSSAEMRQVYAKLHAAARSMATIFITGESGTGKEICAQGVHDASARAAGPFVPLNCGAIPAELLESEVFGHLKGAFTGAIADKAGAAAMADGGTLFLDEVCELDPLLQTKLLRFLQTSTIQPVGAVRPRKVDVRIVCATNRDPLEEVRRGRFREDLFYRLHVVPIHIPPLRARGDDVLEIAECALARLSREEGKAFEGLDAEVTGLFRALPWPGNVRQVLNAFRNVVVLHDGPLVTKAMLPHGLIDDVRAQLRHADLQPADPQPADPHRVGFLEGRMDCAALESGPTIAPPTGPYVMAGNVAPGGVPAGLPIDTLSGRTLAEVERIVIEHAIGRHDGSVTQAARELGVSPSTLYRKRGAWQSEDAT